MLAESFVPELLKETKKGLPWKKTQREGVLTLKLKSYRLVLEEEPDDNLIAVLKVKRGRQVVRQEIVDKDLWDEAIKTAA